MHFLDQHYFTICKELFTPYGFKRYRQSFVRVKNEMLQRFRMERIESGHACRIQFSADPLCMGMEGRAIIDCPGLFELSDLEPGKQCGGWRFDPKSEASMEACIHDIVRYLNVYLLPFFETVDTCKSLCDVYVPLFLHMDHCRKQSMKTYIVNFSPAVSPYPVSPVIYSDSICYAGLKCGNKAPGIRALDDAIAHVAGRYAWLVEQGSFSDDDRSYWDGLVSEWKAMRDQFLLVDPVAILPQLEQNEVVARELLKKYIAN